MEPRLTKDGGKDRTRSAKLGQRTGEEEPKMEPGQQNWGEAKVRRRQRKGEKESKMEPRPAKLWRKKGEEPKMEPRLAKLWPKMKPRPAKLWRRKGEEPKMEPRSAKLWHRKGEEESKMESGLGPHVQQQQPEGPFCNSDAGVGSSSNWEGNSSNNQKKFDVFISYRGPNAKHELASDMYDLLQVRGVEAFLDKEELQCEERFWEAIEEAISCSKVHVCILSSEYAESAWCLKALEMMLDMYEMHKSMLIPVFYDVHPLEVRHLEGAFGQGFQKLLDKGRHSKEVIHKWRGALCKIAGIGGYWGTREHCMTIVDTICKLLDVGALPTSGRVVGRQEQLSSLIHDIMAYRENGLGVTSVEISGVGGIGKTTFAKELYNQICHQYERSCFIEDGRGLVEKHGVTEVHRLLIGKLFNYGLSNFTIEAKKLLKDRLHNAEILVVIDNIDSTIPLSTIFVEDDVYLRPTSIIVVTSREDGVLKHDPRVANYCKHLISLKISNLDFHTSKQLFLQYAFGGIDNVNNEFDEIINKMVKKCHGVPLALALLGRQHVYGREIYVSENIYHSINDGLTPDLEEEVSYSRHSKPTPMGYKHKHTVRMLMLQMARKYRRRKVASLSITDDDRTLDLQQILKVSYINLNTELENCLFLDVATFFRWEKVDYLLKLRQPNYEGGKSEFLSALDVLKKKLLIEVKEGGFLNMHDMLVEFGRSIVQDECQWCPGRRSRVWRPTDVMYMLSQKTGTDKVRALSLHGTDASSPVLDVDEGGNSRPWPADAFGGMYSLEILLLVGNCIEGDLSKLSRRLRWLRWTNFPYQFMPPNLCLKDMRILELSGSPLTRSLNPEPPTNLQALMSLFRRQGLPDCWTRLSQSLRPNANFFFNQLLANTRFPLTLYLLLLITAGPWQRFLP